MEKKYIRLVCLLGLLVQILAARAQPGGWVVKSSNFQFSMNIVAQIETGGQVNSALNNHLAVFSGNQIRGYAKPVAVGGQTRYFLNVYAHTYQDDKLYFQAFIGAENRVYESTDTVVFLHHKIVGTIDQPYILHFTLSPRPLIYSLASIDYVESACTTGPLLDIEASDDQDSEGNGLTYSLNGGADAVKFTLNTATGVLDWNNFTPDFENPMDADHNNTYEVEVKVVDQSGNMSTQLITVTVKDDLPPTAGCPAAKTAKTSDDGAGDCGTTIAGSLDVRLPPGCGTYPVAYLLEGATMGQGTGQLPANQVFAIGKTTVRYTVTDESGTLSSVCSFTVTVTDDEPLNISCPTNKAVNTGTGTCEASVSGLAPTVMDNCAAPVVTYTLTGANIADGTGTLDGSYVFKAGVTTITYIAKGVGNLPPDTCAFTVTVTDNEGPTVSCPANFSVELSSSCFALLTGSAATVSDNCGDVMLAYTLSGAVTDSGTGQLSGGQKFQPGVTTVVYTATDSDGSGQSSCSFTVTVMEKIKPSLACPANQDLPIGANCVTQLPDYQDLAVFRDNCTPDSLLLVVQQPAADTVLNGLGALTVKLTVTDMSGNSRLCTFQVAIQDSPTFGISCPANQQVCVGTVGDYRSLASLMGSCSGPSPVVMQTPTAGTPIAAYNDLVTVTLSANFDGKNTQCTFTVKWADTEPPVARCKNATAVVQANGQAGITAAHVNDASSDNCGLQGLSVTPMTFDCTRKGPNTVTLTATDQRGLAHTCTATVTVSDPNSYCCAAPDARCKTTPTVSLNDAGQATLVVADIDDGSTHDCGLQSIAINPTTANCSNLSAPLTVTLTVIDVTGASDQCTVGVTVRDVTPPSISCPADQTVAADANCSGMVGDRVVLAENLMDNCQTINNIFVTQAPAATAVLSGQNQTTVVTLFANDGNGNMGSCTFNVTLKDGLPPTVHCKTATVELTQAGMGSLTPAAVFLNGTDNCGTVSPVSVEPNTFACNQAGANMVTLTADDGNGNTASCTTSITVVDNIPPVLTCPAGPSVLANVATCTAIVNDINATASDNCSYQLGYAMAGVTTGSGSGQLSGLPFNSGETTVTYTATDGANNSTSCSFVVRVSPCFKGRIIWKQNQTSGVKDVTVAVTGDQSSSAVTGLDGNYGFVFASGANFSITPTKNLNILNGVNASDAFRIQQHLSNNPITDPWQLIAADVSCNNVISSLDANIIQLSLLGNPQAMAQFVKSWRFVPVGHTLANPPWGFPEQINIVGTGGLAGSKDFYGVKVGDLAAVYANPANGGQGQPLILRTPNAVLAAGDTLTVDFSADPLADLAALQFALRFDPSQLQWLHSEPLGGIPLTADNFGAFAAKAGELRVVWVGSEPIALKQAAPVLRFRFKVLEGGARLSEALRLYDEVLPSGVYSGAYYESAVSLRFESTTPAETPATAGIQLYQNRPNPFTAQTRIAFELPEGCTAQLRIVDLRGRVVAERLRQYPAGRQEEDFQLEGATGVLYYELTTPFGILTRRMVAAN